MKKIFYRTLMVLIFCSYFPLLLIYLFHYCYTNYYLELDTKNKLFTAISNERIVKLSDSGIDFNGVYMKKIKYKDREEKNDFFKYFNKIRSRMDIDSIPVGEYKVSQLKFSKITNYYYLVKKISDKEILVAVTEIINPKLISVIMTDLYKTYSILVIPLSLLIAYNFSKKFSEPIETLEKISTKMSNLDFSDKIEIKSKNELSILAKNINNMATKIKDTIVELNETNEKLKIQLLEKKKTLEKEKMFMSAIGHELKTPIAIINGYLEALQDGIIGDEEREKTYEIIYNEGLSIDKLIKDINYYLKLGRNSMEINLTEIQLKSYLEKTFERYRLDFVQKNIEFEFVGVEKKIVIDEKYLVIILNNILTNALTYVDDRKKIQVILDEESLCIRNSSEEMTKDEIDKIFSPFYKKDSSRNRKYGGTGLGLAIVKEVLELFDLKYRFEYSEDKFANFIITNFTDNIDELDKKIYIDKID